jgi:hypothetical protein
MRTDPHSPKNLVTEDYEYLYAIDNTTPWALHLDIAFLRDLANHDPDTADRGNSQCHHCGAHIRYAAYLRYLPTGRTIVVGETCLDNRFERATADFQRLRKTAELDRKAHRIRKARDEFVAENPDLAFLNDPEAEISNSFVADVARKFRTYGELSERQVNAIRKAIARDIEREAEKAKEAELAVPVPEEGRIVVTGKVLTTKLQESIYGVTHKMLLQVPHAGGFWKLWTTQPKSLVADGVERGTIVTIKVNVTRSDDDPCFAFGKRPSEVTA